MRGNLHRASLQAMNNDVIYAFGKEAENPTYENEHDKSRVHPMANLI